MRNRPSLLQDQRGLVLSATFLVVVLWLVLGGATLGYSQLDLRSTSHYATGNQAFFSAEAGIVHSLRRINSIGVIRFDADIADRWGELFGGGSRSFADFSRYSYQVSVQPDPLDPTNRGMVTAVGRAPLQARRVIRVSVAKGGFRGSPGAVHLTGDAPDPEFTGTAFDIDGNNYDKFGAPAAGDPVPGVSARTDSAAADVADSLDNLQQGNVRGLGYGVSPLTPSIKPTNGPGPADLSQMLTDILATPGVVQAPQTSFTGSHAFGTLAAPQITHLTHANVSLDGTVSGAGVLIADGSISVGGTLDFVGWMIVGGNTVIDTTGGGGLGNATILGSLWTTDLSINAGGSAILNYCEECLQMVDDIVPGPANLVPRAMTVTAWTEVL